MTKFAVRRFRLVGAMLAFFILAAVLQSLWFAPDMAVFARLPEQTLIIDAGHGGEDGGAVSPAGNVESFVNLAIARDLEALMGFYGVHAEMTRREDVSIHDSSAATLREKKVSDLHNRVELINQTGNAVLISIHQNSYPSPQYHGTQVFYANGSLSLPLAECIQETARAALEAENDRQPKEIPKTVYLMNHISCPAVLVECGFLSNPEEDRLLQQRDYQRKLAMVLASAYLTYGRL